MNRGEKRRVQRIQLDQPIAARLGVHPVTIMDLSTTGLRVEHDFPLSAKGRTLRVSFTWGGVPVEVDCQVVRCRLQKSAFRPDTICYSSGLRFSTADAGSAVSVRRLVASLVETWAAAGTPCNTELMAGSA